MAVFSKLSTALLIVAGTLTAQTNALGINCRGSGLCNRAGFENSDPESIMEVLRRVVLASNLDNSTTFNSGDHITCLASGMKVDISANAGVGAGPAEAGVSFGFGGTSHDGGICLFPQSLKNPLSLGDAKELIDSVIQHGCSNCGSVPIHFAKDGNNDPGDGILTFNYVKAPSCVGNCIDPESPAGTSTSADATASATIPEPKEPASATSTGSASATSTDSASATSTGSASATSTDSVSDADPTDSASATSTDSASDAAPTDSASATKTKDSTTPSHTGKAKPHRKTGPLRRTPYEN